MFIPFMGTFIALKDAPPDAWVEAQVGIGGPLLGSAGAAACLALGLATDTPLLVALAYSGFFLNLFNLVPIGFLDGGRIAAALSPWLWLAGAAGTLVLMFLHFNFILLLIFVLALPRLWSLFRRKSDEEQRYYEVTPSRRLAMGALYFGLAAALVIGMRVSQIQPG
jgi:Zn-dependent protease